MSMLSITPAKTVRNTATILSEDLILPKFNTVQSALSNVDAGDVEASKKYLELKQASEIDTAYNEAIARYTSEFELASTDIQRNANIALQDMRMQASEGIGGSLGTGAQSDLNADLAAAVATDAQEQQTDLLQQFTQTLTALSAEYDTVITDIFGENFSNLLDYNENVDLFSMAILKEIANTAGWEYTDNASLQKTLVKHGMITQVGDTTEFTLTSSGQHEISKILQTLDPQYGADYSGRLDRLTENVVTSVMASRYPVLSPEDTTYQNKAAELSMQFNEWLSENMATMYYTDLGLATFDGTSIIVTPHEQIAQATRLDISDSLTSEGVPVEDFVIESAYGINDNNRPYVSTNYGQNARFGFVIGNPVERQQFNQLLADAKSGKMPNGSLFIAPDGQMYYYDNGKVYFTDGPDAIDPAVLYGFDKVSYLDNARLNDVFTGKLRIGTNIRLGGNIYGLGYTYAADGLLYRSDIYNIRNGILQTQLGIQNRFK